MEGLIGFGSIIAFIFSVIIFCTFIFSVIIFCILCGIFVRLGRIEIILKKMAIHQGAIEKEVL
jgi:hypothetical protein